ncbi:MAG: sugar phosphate isomerase/epimerase [Oscillospiraceae bacterium]|nr:sugar phosphate isomerase/epimerase [Oscillospiraceae bacterium]
MKLGAQMYTVRNQCKTPEDLDRSLEKLAEIGYRTVQLSGFPYDPAAVRRRCDELGLSVELTHSSGDRITGDTDRLIEDHRILGCTNVGIGGFPGERTPEGVRKFIADFTPAMEKIAAAGMKFQYHNHGFEFQKFDGVTLLDILRAETDPRLMGFTLDTYWVQYGGACVADTVTALAGRIDVFHFKDMAMTAEGQRFAPVGDGNLSWDTILAALERAGAKVGFVEQDDCYGEDPFACLARSYRYLSKKM